MCNGNIYGDVISGLGDLYCSTVYPHIDPVRNYFIETGHLMLADRIVDWLLHLAAVILPKIGIVMGELLTDLGAGF